MRGKQIIEEVDFLKAQGETRERVMHVLAEAQVKPDSLKRLLARQDRGDLHDFLFATHREPKILEHGDPNRYLAGCRCDLCRIANSERHKRFRQAKAAETKDPSDPRHGNPSFYTNHGCRCDKCKAAHKAKLEAQYRKRIAKPIDPNDTRHGSLIFYSGHGCRCEPCKEASRLYQTRRKEK